MEKLQVEEPIISKESGKNPNKKLIITIISIIGIILIVIAIIAIIIISQEEYTDPPVFTYGLNLEELKYRTNEINLTKIILLNKTSSQYNNLEENDKEVLKLLIEAGELMENIHLRIDNEKNKDFKDFLNREIKKNVEKAKLTKILFDAQKGVNSIDFEGNIINLAKDIPRPFGLGVFPSDLNSSEIIDILYNMLSDNNNINNTQKVKDILNQRTMVLKDGNILKSEDYNIFFKDEFEKIAEKLEKAAELSTNNDFKEYLKLQATALKKVDEELDTKADIKWSELKDTPLEFTLVRENFLESMTNSIMNNETFMNLLNSKGITPIAKDSLGIRVGIVNKERTKLMNKINDLLPELEKLMPFYELYENNSLTKEALNQTYVDVDLVYMSGIIGAFRGFIPQSESLPNDDKISIKEKRGGKRTVYHRQIIEYYFSRYKSKLLDKILVNELHQYYDLDYYNLFLVTHDIGYNLGPIIENSSLEEEYEWILEENKADMISLGFIDNFIEKKIINETQAKKIIITSIINLLPMSEPNLYSYSAVSSVMAINYFIEKEVCEFIDNKIKIDENKISSVAKSMLNEIIEIQLNNDNEEAKNFVEKYFKWNNSASLEIIANHIYDAFPELAYSMQKSNDF